MDFGRSIKKRAKQIDNKLDQIVPNPYEGQVKEHYSKVKKPLFISLGAAAACICIAFGSIGIVEILKHNNSNKGSVTFNPDYQPKPKPDKPKPYTGSIPIIDLRNYVSSNFGFAEFSYFSFFANDTSLRKMMAPERNVFEDCEEKEEKVYTALPPTDSYYDDDGRIHEPLPICEKYSFSDFLYFEFTTTNDTFLEERIGNGHIQALSVHTSVYDEDILILKNGNKFYSCLGTGKSNDSLGKITELNFSAHKYIEDWEIIKDDNELPLTIYFKTGKGYKGAATMEINKQSYDINPTSVFYLDYSFSISVNQVRQFIGLDPDPRFDGKQINLETKEIDCTKIDSFVLEEFGDTSFVINSESDNRVFFMYGDRKISLNGYNLVNKDKFYVSDINDDGFRDFVYLSGKGNGPYLVTVYDALNDKLMVEDIQYRNHGIGFMIHENKLVAFQGKFIGQEDEIVYDYADIVCDKPDNSKITLAWRNIYEVKEFTFNYLKDSEGNRIYYDYEENNCLYYSAKKDEHYYMIFTIERNTENPDIVNFTPEKAGFDMLRVQVDDGIGYGSFNKISDTTYSLEIEFGGGITEFFFTLSKFETIHFNVKTSD